LKKSRSRRSVKGLVECHGLDPTTEKRMYTLAACIVLWRLLVRNIGPKTGREEQGVKNTDGGADQERTW
jgi:hypothetical protein